MKLSVVDLGTIQPGTSETEALAESLRFAQRVEELGFHRIWFAEHHGSAMGASHHPELLIAAAGTKTSHIRIGSGSVLMNHYSPFKVAEMFTQLEAMFPGRVDLGMGRATAGPVIDLALQRNREHREQSDHPQQVSETLAWLHNRFPADHPFAQAPLLAAVPQRPRTWLLGSSPGGAELAAALGIGYTFAGFINPPAAATALRNYREKFQTRGFGLKQPLCILAVNVTVGENTAEAARLVGSAKAFYARLHQGNLTTLVPTAEEAEQELRQSDWDQPTTIVDGRWPQFVAGSPTQVRATLEQMLSESGADEIMIQNMIPAPEARHHSHALIAEIFNLKPPHSSAMT